MKKAFSEKLKQTIHYPCKMKEWENQVKRYKYIFIYLYEASPYDISIFQMMSQYKLLKDSKSVNCANL
jgi:hypothetical protein